MAERRTAEEKTRELELNRRRRVAHGWAFRSWTREQAAEIHAWLDGETDTCPASYTKLNETVK